MAGGGPHNHEHLAGTVDLHSRDAYVSIHIGYSNGSSGKQSQPAGNLGGQLSRLLPQRGDGTGKFLLHQMFQLGMESFKKGRGGISIPLVPQGLVAAGTGAARIPAGELPDDPVAGFQDKICLVVDLGSLLHDLPDLGPTDAFCR